MKCHALTQIKLPGRIANCFPGHGQSRAKTLVLVRVDQAIKDVAGQLVVGSQIVVVRIYGAGFGFQTDP